MSDLKYETALTQWAFKAFHEMKMRQQITQKDLGAALGISQPQVARLLNGDRRITVSEIPTLEKFFNRKFNPEQSNLDLTLAPHKQEVVEYLNEYDVSVSAGGGSFIENENVKAKWPFNPDYLAGYLGLNNAHLAIVEVAGDSMEPTLSTGDRVMVNMNDVSISQPGIFVVYDGYGTVIKRVERILGSEGGIRLISDNIRHKTYEVDDQTVNIVGRVIWAAKRL